jgi:predicted nucleotidyltransferase
MIISQKIKRNLINLIENDLIFVFKKDKNIVAVYLFGSYAKGTVSYLSDVDLGILFEDKFTYKELINKYNFYFHQISNILKTNEVDLIILNEAQPSFAYEIIKEGKLLYCNDEEKLKIFIEKTVKEYLDTSSIREEYYFHLRERIRNNKFAR